MKKREFSSEETRTIVQLYQESPHSNTSVIGSQFGVSSIVIDRVLREQGIVKKKGGFPVLYPVVNGKKQCRTCKEWKPLETDYSKSHGTKYRSDCKQCRVKQFQDVNRQKLYGLTAEQYRLKLLAQNGVCAICKRPEAVKLSGNRVRTGLSVDHDHETGLIRDLLCSWCNRALGFIKDDPERAKALIEYLDKWKG